MLNKIKKAIESHRNSKHVFWKSLVLLKDAFWKLFISIKNISCICSHKDPMALNVKWNKETWSNYPWNENGDMWNGFALFCKQPYSLWKQSIVEAFIHPSITKESVVLEIAPGIGRWTQFLLNTKKLWLVDLNKVCIKKCKERFSSHQHIEYVINNGKILPFIPMNSIDFIWSFDAFVHMDKNVIHSYFKEFSRILKPNGKAIIHHHNFDRSKISLLMHAVRKENIKKILTNENLRTSITKKDIAKLARKCRLTVVFQVDSWGENNKYNCKFANDYITCITKKY